MASAAIGFTPDTFGVGRRIYGRHSANRSFLRAAVVAAQDRPVVGYGLEAQHAPAFLQLLQSISPTATGRWLFSSQTEAFAAQGVLQRLDPSIGAEVWARSWAGLGRYSISALTHTTFHLLPALAQLVRDQLTPWDALVCTSESVRSTVQAVWEAEIDYARWRYGASARPMLPQLPVIPLGVHVEDFAFSDSERAAARQELGVGQDEVVCLYLGRLSLTSKAHPGQMYRGLQAAAKRTGARVQLMECGWVKDANDEQTLRTASGLLAPDVARRVLDGNDAAQRRLAWAAADIFVSLSDNIQETFGLTPLEAMAAGLPLVISDWDGYRQTARDGVDGFLIPTWSPAPGFGAHFALAYQARTITDDTLSWAAASASSVEHAKLVDALAALIQAPDLRRRMGAAGRERAREVFDWNRIFAQYQSLWDELDERRRADGDKAMAVRSGAQLEPFTAFAGYPTRHIGAATRLQLAPGAQIVDFRSLGAHPLFPSGVAQAPLIEPLWRLLETGAQTAGDAAVALQVPVGNVVLAAGLLAKMGFAVLEDAGRA